MFDYVLQFHQLLAQEGEFTANDASTIAAQLRFWTTGWLALLEQEAHSTGEAAGRAMEALATIDQIEELFAPVKEKARAITLSKGENDPAGVTRQNTQ